MKFIYIFIFGIFFINNTTSLNAQSFIEKDSLNKSIKSKIDTRSLHGRWHLVEIILKLDNTNELGSKAEQAYKKSSESQRKVKKQIQQGELAIITQFNYDGTYSHQLVYADEKIRFPSYRETGTWTFNENSNQLLRKANNKEITTLEATIVKHLHKDELVLELTYTDLQYEGIYKGLTETLFLKRFHETKANK